jgi:hypothetical protein
MANKNVNSRYNVGIYFKKSLGSGSVFCRISGEKKAKSREIEKDNRGRKGE